MARNVTIATMTSDIRFLADQAGSSAVARTPDVDILRHLNQSLQAFRRKVSDHGLKHFLTSYSSTMTSGPTSPFAFKSLDLSTGPSPALVRVYGMEITIAGRVRSLECVDFDSRNDFQRFLPTSTGEPRAFAPYQTYKLAILPAPAAGYPFTIWYLPVFADLTNVTPGTTDVYDGVDGWEQWAEWDVVLKLTNRDQYAQAWQMATTARDTLWSDIADQSSVMSANRPVKKVDVRGMRSSARNTWVRDE